MTLELRFGIEVEHLDNLSTSEGEDVGRRVHHDGFGRHWTTSNLRLVLEVHEGELGGFNRDDPSVGLHSREAMFDARFGDSELLELVFLDKKFETEMRFCRTTR